MKPTQPPKHVDTTRFSSNADLRSIAASTRGGVSLVVHRRGGVDVVPLAPNTPVVVGRTAPSEIVVADPSLSRQHARLVLDGDQVHVEDLGSTNGTWVDGQAIREAKVRVGSEVTVGAVTVAIQRRNHAPTPTLGLHSHDRFVAALDQELGRARHFGRSFALLMVRVEESAECSLHRWAPAVRSVLRHFDRMAFYGPQMVELLLPEMSASETALLAEALAALQSDDMPPLLCGVCAYPESATSVEALLEACRHAVQTATPLHRVVVAQPASAVELSSGRTDQAGEGGLVAESEAMRNAIDMGRKVARGVIPVLLHGETGTGKEVIARFIHEQGPRAGKPMVAVNCAAIPSQLVESTLFGHEKGAFTGADQRHQGVFEAASGGTVLLDEIGELPAEAQAALLRVLETKSVTRVGSTKEIPIDVRIMAASHRDLEAMSNGYAFRTDLLFRLNAFTLHVPALRDREKDIEPLACRFLELANEANHREIRSIAPEALAALRAYAWPGNVRELRNAIERAVVIAQHVIITVADLPAAVQAAANGTPATQGARAASHGNAVSSRQPASTDRPSRLWNAGEDFRSCMSRLEARVLVEALQHAGGNQSEAARLLQMPRRTLVHKLKVHGIRRSGYAVQRPE